ncbi:MAG TPA: ATP-binding protein [Pirellulales bacterium]|jgi:signal transduction histidine kinase|nr:ATP-binding protein [Pirellulales bacterium]
MTRSVTFADPISLDASADLETVLAAWHGATVRLEQTHEALRNEVQRLTHELEIKNRELARKSRLADIGQMASHVAHEVRNSLVPVTLYLSLLRRRLSDDSGSRDIVEKIAVGFTDLEATVNDLLQFTADRDPCWQRIEVRNLVEEVIGSLAPQFVAQSIETVLDVPRQQTVTADRDMLRRAVLNLSLNALDAMPDGGRLFVTSYFGPDGLELEIADTGPGLSEQAQRRAFEPFFTTKSNGTGLGLAIVDRIAEVHGGDVAAANCPEGGAAFTIRIPTRRLEAAA